MIIVNHKLESPIKTIICGGRDTHLTDEDKEYLKTINITEVVSGAASGIDSDAIIWAKENKIPVIPMPAKWDDLSHPDAIIKKNKAGKLYDARAGFRRNEEMAKIADACVIFAGGNGTDNMRSLAHQYNLKLYTNLPETLIKILEYNSGDRFQEYLEEYVAQQLSICRKNYSNNIASYDYDPFIESVLSMGYKKFNSYCAYRNPLDKKRIFDLPTAFAQYQHYNGEYPFNFIVHDTEIDSQDAMHVFFNSPYFSQYFNDMVDNLKAHDFPEQCLFCEYGMPHTDDIVFTQLSAWSPDFMALSWYYFIGVKTQDDYEGLRSGIQTWNSNNWQERFIDNGVPYSPLLLYGDYLDDYIGENYPDFKNLGKYVITKNNMQHSKFNLDDIKKWCDTSLQGRFIFNCINKISLRTILFEYEEDMMYFKLIWYNEL